MLNTKKHQGFTVHYDKPTNELITPIKISLILTTDTKYDNALIEIEALWDTGAIVTCIKPTLWERLKLVPFDAANSIELAGIGGRVTTNFTFVNLFLTPELETEYCQVYSADFPGSADMLIGMNVIGLGDFAICNADDKTTFSFAMPPFPDKIDLAEKAKLVNKQS